MVPREELLRDFDALVDNYHASRQETRAMLNQYAIGRWVPVEERLPKFDELGVWEGYARLNNDIKSTEAGQWDEGLLEHTTHWLELDIPEVSQ